RDGYKKATELWKALPSDTKKQNPDWIDPKFAFTEDKLLADQLTEFSIVEFGKQFFYQPSEIIDFDIKPQPSFNKDFNLLIHNIKKNESEKVANFIFTDSAKQAERLYTIIEDIDKTVKFNHISISLREGFIDYGQK